MYFKVVLTDQNVQFPSRVNRQPMQPISGACCGECCVLHVSWGVGSAHYAANLSGTRDSGTGLAGLSPMLSGSAKTVSYLSASSLKPHSVCVSLSV